MLQHAFLEAPLLALLAEQQTSGTTQTIVAYFATHSFATRPTDSPANRFFDGRLTRGIRLERRIAETDGGQFGSVMETDFGELELVNDGRLDWMLRNFAADGRKLVLKIGATQVDSYGHEIVQPYANFATVYTSVSGSWTFEHDVVRLRIESLANRLRGRMQINTYAGSGGQQGSADMTGRTLPLAIGRCLNVSAQMVDPTLLIYQVHHARVNEIDPVYDAGIALLFSSDYATYAALATASVPAGRYATSLAAGCFRLGSIPTGRVTANVRGDIDNTSGQYVSIHASVLRMILRDYGGLPGADLDAASFADTNTLQPGAMGIYLPAGDQSTILEVVERIAFSGGLVIGQDRSGLYRVFRLDPPSSTADWFFDDRDIMSIEQLPLPYGVPWYTWGVGYGRNWTVQDDAELATSVSQERRQFLNQESRYAYTTNGAILTRHASSSAAPLRESLFVDKTSAEDEADRLIALYGAGRAMYAVTVKNALFSVALGKTVRVTYPRWDLDGGQNFVVMRIADDADRVETRLEVFG